MTGKPVHLYYHSPCFDGTISAVLLADYLQSSANHRVELHPVNYHLNDVWEKFTFEEPAAIVDFQYHPSASIWFDHHSTAFLTPDFEADYRRRNDRLVRYDPSSPSCALLIWKQQLAMRGDHLEKVMAADRIDSARYDSPHEAVFGDAPAFRINASLASGETDDYSRFLIRQLLNRSLQETASLPEVEARYAEFTALRDRGMQSFTPTNDLQARDGFTVTAEGIVLFAVDDSAGAISRYAPFTVAPDASYSIGLTRSGDRAKISAMRNPWRQFESVALGQIFKTFGGGGHQRVASTRLHGKSRAEAVEVLLAVRDAIQSAIEEQARKTPA